MITDNNTVTLLGKYVSLQVSTYFPDGSDIQNIILEHIPTALKKTQECIKSIIPWKNQQFNYLISGQYTTFLYFLANCLWNESNKETEATKIFLLNKALNGIDLFFEIKMPQHFFISHSVGAVFAKANYGDYCVFHQGCTVGRNRAHRPTLENGIVMFPGSMIIGNCIVRENSVIAPNVALVNTDTPGNCYVFSGKSGRPIFKELNKYFADEYFVRSETL